MPFYLRKSISAGPFRFNLSKSGVGLSVGVRGLRVGTGPRGHYVHAGAGGVYYRSSIGKAGGRQSSDSAAPVKDEPSVVRPSAGRIEMIEVDSGDVLAMRDTNYAAVLDDINSKHQKWSLSKVLAFVSGVGGLVAGAVVLPIPFVGVAAAVPGWLIGRWLDSYCKRSVLFYDLEPDAEAAYRRVTEAFDVMMACEGKWHVSAGGAVRDLTTWKQNAGASHVVDKKPTSLDYSLPPVIKSNITPPSIGVGTQRVHFLPDVMLIEDNEKIGAIGYADLELRSQNTRFIEDGRVPRDAEVVGQTWQHPNKSGGPDRRYASNRQIPVCLYEVLYMTSGSGLNEMLEFSRIGVCGPFANALRQLALPAKKTRTSPRVKIGQAPAVTI